MNTPSLSQSVLDSQENFERMGAAAYHTGHSRYTCVNDAMRRGWEEAAGADAYWRSMMAEADDRNEDVSYPSGWEVFA
jgi:hypothetical protein